MIRRWLLCVAMAGAAAGCHGGTTMSVMNPSTSWTEIHGLKVSISADHRQFSAGDLIPVTVRLRNDGAKPIAIEGVCSARVSIYVYRQGSTGSWQRFAEYPKNTLEHRNRWVIQPQEEDAFDFSIPVEPMWPTNEQLRLNVHICGWPPTAEPFVPVWVAPPPKEST